MTNYVDALMNLCTALGIAVPSNIRADQKLTAHLLKECLNRMQAGDYVATEPGDAAASDIALGKIAYVDGQKIIGTLTFAELPRPVIDLSGDLLARVEGAFILEGFFDGIVLLDEENEVVATAAHDTESDAWLFDLAPVVTAEGPQSFYVQYIAKPDVTITDSALAPLAFTAHAVARELTGCEDTAAQPFAVHNMSFTGKLELLEGFTTLPAVIQVTVGELPLDETQFVYSAASGEYSINGEAVTDTITITAAATA